MDAEHPSWTHPRTKEGEPGKGRQKESRDGKAEGKAEVIAEGKAEGIALPHAPCTLLRRVGGYSHDRAALFEVPRNKVVVIIDHFQPLIFHPN